jgi:LysM repeat protein
MPLLPIEERLGCTVVTVLVLMIIFIYWGWHTQSLSSAPVATPTLLPPELFVSPLPSVESPMAMIEEFAIQTSVVQTAVANSGILNTPTKKVPAGTVVNPTAVPAGVRPASYTLQNGEFPGCIARRFNVDMDAILSASGLTSPDLYYPGLTLTIPQSGAFPGSRMLTSHPVTYSVLSSEETMYSIACKFGDIDPATIASANSISISAKLTAGQQLQIP